MSVCLHGFIFIQHSGKVRGVSSVQILFLFIIILHSLIPSTYTLLQSVITCAMNQTQVSFTCTRTNIYNESSLKMTDMIQHIYEEVWQVFVGSVIGVRLLAAPVHIS